MAKLITNIRLNHFVCKLEIEAADISKKALPGQFIILRIDEKGERIPLTVFRCNPDKGTIEIIVQEAGTTTLRLCALKNGSDIRDIIGPLGLPAEIKKYGKVLCIAGGVGIAEIYPVAEALRSAGNEVISIIGSRTKELLILEKEMGLTSSKLYVTTDDGSYSRKGFVSDVLKELLAKTVFSVAFVVGPVLMMKNVAEITRPYSLKTIVSLNSIMVDGTGMCGSCRVRVGEGTKFVCVDGPDFDAHLVDFDELLARQKRFNYSEQDSAKKFQKEHRSCLGK